MTMLQWPTFSAMRGDAGRAWFRMSDLIDASVAAGRRMTRHQILQSIAHLKAPDCKRYGHWHYTQEHMDAVLAASSVTAESLQ